MFQTILANENELDINPQEIDPLDHPQYFIKMRYQGLNNVQTKIQYERTVTHPTPKKTIFNIILGAR